MQDAAAERGNREEADMTRHRESSRITRYLVRTAAPALTAAIVCLATFPASPQQVDLGFRTYKQKVECGRCHGWSGEGVQDDPRAPRGADLRTSTLDRAGLIEVIKCGRPGTEMPHFDERAFTDKRCYDSTAAELGNKVPPFSGIGLIGREIEAVADYLLAKVVGKGKPTRAECEEYFGAGAAACKDVPIGN
jgi:mono/diheme cytochrome c family protein